MNKPTFVMWYSFLTFELPINYERLKNQFNQIHTENRGNYPEWPVVATRRKLVNAYWFYALIHFALLVAIGAVISYFFINNWNILGFSLLITCACCLYLPLYIFLYQPIFTEEFIPRLETVVAEFEGKEKAELDKCKQSQMSTRAIVLFYYIVDKCSQINCISPSDHSAILLQRIFGVSSKGIKNELDLIFKKGKRENLAHRKQLEITKSFEEVYAILQEMQFEKGIQLLKELEFQFIRPV